MNSADTPKTKHTPGPWEVQSIHAIDIENGVVTTHFNQPARVVIVHQYLDDQGRRCTQYVGEAYITAGHEGETDGNGRLFAAAANVTNRSDNQ